ncbi:hypothetical protein COCMIDRAFT_5229 [Bipolaris oryzae ATCC 44560]|uniref:RNI-like protein n=1 Tax=Bipolaris oryzae ATCC 44560 TaxID=930090 RepID=W6ZPR5_COCMI|nr:uncharacterized protein COCMIDRAFT_5229 [Bipolaris oryzae ATCC 44560]EUC45606.1 hypothetical protein COCMIDRAFT_5229 [Bipolaris oryzae ATCC 44560]
MTTIQTSTDAASAMEDIHGVDVSWLHHSTRDHHHRQRAPSSPGLSRDAPPKTSSHGGIPVRPRHDEQQTQKPTPATNRPASPPRPSPVAAASAPVSPVTATPPIKAPPKRPTLLSRGSSEKNVNGTTPPDSRLTSRRNSWMSTISSKFSSQNSPAQTTHAQAQGSHASPYGANHASPSANGALNGIQAASTGHNGGPDPYVPQQPKTSFVGNVLRRLSSGSQVNAVGKVYPNGGVCPRKVMNVDPNRERCLVPELDQHKLRKVAFCVDVEIAGGPKYKDEAVTDEKQPKQKEKKMKERSEGEALKNPDTAAEQKEKAGVIAVAQEAVGNENEPNPEGTVIEDKQETSKKKEKKKRSEAERKERKEKKRRKAEENGTIPLELTRDDDSGSAEGVSAASRTTAAPRAQDRPTIDPLRIYRRCCQLRESPILKRISDQLAAPSACAVVQPGVVTCLDLTGSRLQLADFLTLSDWLAIVPVKKLFLEDADLTDEKIRLVLAGLLAAKVPEPPKRRSLSSDGTQDGLCQAGSSAVKKLVLKNNPKITSEGWKHIALFLYMCKSIVAVDVSMILFPNSQPQVASPSTDSTPVLSPTKDTKSADIADIFSKAISERLGGSELQELAMAECNLSSASIRKIIDGCVMSGIQRLSLATNDIDSEGFEHVLRYLRSGVCQGLDIGGNDLRSWIGQLGESISHCENSPLWALCLQDTGLTPESLKALFPVLVSLPSFKFLDLSHNRGLFMGQTSLCLLRKYMPQLKELKRIHLVNVDMKLEDAIAIAEILPDCPQIAHINILENPEITRVATSTDEETQEDAAALYASLTLAARLSKSLICVDVDIPAPEQSEVVKALAKQVVAYCLRNIESINEVPELRAAPKQVEVPRILMRLVGPDDEDDKENDNASSADDDYIVGGTGIAKAMSYCLSHKESDLSRVSNPSGTSTPRSRSMVPVLEEPSKARAMSKDLLDTARTTRSRIQPALIREAKSGNDINYRRLLFLDQTLQGMIQRFEDEYPETRLQPSEDASTSSSLPSTSPTASTAPALENSVLTDMTAPESDEDEPPTTLRSRHNSDVSLASRNMSLEEGRLHRFGHRVRTGLLNSRPSTPDDSENQSPFLSGTADDEGFPEHIESLREYFMNHSGDDELRHMIEGKGWEEAFDSVVKNAEELKNLEREDPTHFKIFKESQIAALKNRNPDLFAPGEKHVKSDGNGDDFAVED